MVPWGISIILAAVIPAAAIVGEAIFDIDIKVVLTEQLFVVYHVKIPGINLQTVRLVVHCELRQLKFSVPDNLGGAVLKFAGKL